LTLDHDGEAIESDGVLENRRIYYYVPSQAIGTFSNTLVAVPPAYETLTKSNLSHADLISAVDLEVIKMKSSVDTDTETRNDFRTDLLS
jgi:hypothetical protein